MTQSIAQATPQAAPVRRVVRDLSYVGGAAPDPLQRLDLYLPEAQQKAFPVLIAVHGGGLAQGDKAGSAQIGQRFARAGIGTAVINHRLSPTVSHPEHVRDVAAAFAWTLRSIAEFGGDPTRVFLTGHSSGAYLVSLLATDPRYLEAHGINIGHIRGVVAVSGFYRVDRVAPQRDKVIWGERHDDWLAASPSQHLHAKLPPALFVYADGDDAARRAENIEIAAAARRAGSQSATSLEITDRDHGTLWQRIAEEHDPLAQRIIEFVRAHGAAGSRA